MDKLKPEFFHCPRCYTTTWQINPGLFACRSCGHGIDTNLDNLSVSLEALMGLRRNQPICEHGGGGWLGCSSQAKWVVTTPGGSFSLLCTHHLDKLIGDNTVSITKIQSWM